MLAANQKNRRLPGFRFEALVPAREDVLPRMDVALFVGFAASGPVGIPVAIESAERFKSIFGADLPLVWDAEKGETIYAYLAPTVRSFFRNGGRRCWILRVARLQANEEHSLNRACFNYFPLPGFAAVDFGENEIGDISPAFARARARGSWSDDLEIGAAVLSKPVRFRSLKGGDAEKRVVTEIGASDAVAKGDLIKLTFRDEKLNLLLAVDEFKEIKSAPNAADGSRMPPFGKRTVEFSSKRFVWVKDTSGEILTEKNYKVRVRMWTGQKKTESENSAESLSTERSAIFFLEKGKNSEAPGKVRLTFSNLSPEAVPAAGTLLFTKLKKENVALMVEAVGTGKGETAADSEILCRAVSCRRKLKHPESTPQAALLTFELQVRKGSENLTKVGDLAFNDGHERFWGNLPSDEQLYRFSDDSAAKIPAWTQTGAAADFSLSGGVEREDFYFPLFADSFTGSFLGAVPLSGTKLQRDGLEVFDESLFLDRKLKTTGTANLPIEAEFIRYLSSRPRSLWGIHTALIPETMAKIASESSPSNPAYANYSLEECTIIAVPDAVHRGWAKREDDGAILSPPLFSPPLRPEWWSFQDCRARDMRKISRPLWGNFLDCELRVIEAPENLRVRGEGAPSGKFTIEWKSKESDENLEFVLEESVSPEFEFPQEIFRGKAKHFEIRSRRAAVYYYRVRAEIGKYFSDWSKGLAIKIPAAENWAAKRAEDYRSDVLLAVQRALLRMCAARGDLFAVLNLPAHFGETDAFAHVGTLRATRGLAARTSGVEPLSADETKALSFGAVYHPWLLTREEDFEGFRYIPPDGAIGGTFASRAESRGAWIAPANEVLQGVLGLEKQIRRERFLDFQDNAVNLVRQEPRGFLVLDSGTLSVDADLRQINVRRLLNLLRRLAVKHGAQYVFEPNNERFQRQVQRGFEALLDYMFTRGAFAGATPANSYQVAVSAPVNNFQSMEQGRFIVELRVAPSLPLKFVTVRLINSAGRNSVVEVF